MNTTIIIRPEHCIDKMLDGLLNGKEKGSTTYNDEIDKCWKWRRQETNLWTGYANEGKSIFLKQLCTIKALEDNWRFLFAAPEDYPPEEFFDDVIHTVVGRTTDMERVDSVVDPETYLRAYELIKNNLIFVYTPPPDNTIVHVLEEFEEICGKENIDGCVIDPIIKFARPKKFSDRDDIYAAYVGGLCVDFARRTKTSLHLVMHQLTPTMDLNTRNYSEPSMYKVKGGGTWSDGFDNVLFVWRPEYATDKLSTDVIFGSQKIKKQKLVAIPQKIKIGFDRKSNRYVYHGTQEPLMNYDKFINPERKLIL